MGNIDDARQKIDRIDEEIVHLFQQRMALAGEIAREKQRTGAPVLHKDRENAVLARLEMQVDPAYHAALRQLYETIFRTSRLYQATLLERGSEGCVTL